MKKLSLIIFISAAVIAGFPSNTVYVDVNGLVCDFCARAIEKVFSKQPAVADIDVNLDKKIIKIQFNTGQRLDDNTITQLITDSGYAVRSIRHEN
jgi:copper chaperone CopZ